MKHLWKFIHIRIHTHTHTPTHTHIYIYIYIYIYTHIIVIDGSIELQSNYVIMMLRGSASR